MLVKKRQIASLTHLDGYSENHHIIPKCLGGLNNKENMVLFTAREHYIAHLLLTKMYEGDAKKKMHYAFYSMRRKKIGMERYEPNSHIYEILVKKINRNPSIESRLKMSTSQKNRAPISPENRAKLAHAVKASYTPELRAIRSKHFKNKVFTEEHRRNLSQGQKDKVMPNTFIEYCKQRRGEKNSRSKTWTLMSPSGEVFVTKAMTDFCASRGLTYSAFRNRARMNLNLPLEKGPAKGWSLLSCI